MDCQTLRDSVHRFNQAGPDGLLDKWSPGPASRLSPEPLAELTEIVETGPDPSVDGVECVGGASISSGSSGSASASTIMSAMSRRS